MPIVKRPINKKKEHGKFFKITTSQMEILIAKYFNPRTNLIIPNVSWGFEIHECDIIVLTQAGYLYEVEIKISLSDLKKDVLKKHSHLSHKIKCLHFAIPKKLEKYIEYIPDRAGILSIDEWGCISCIRSAITQKTECLSIYEKWQIARLGALRIWSLKKKIEKQKSGIVIY